MQIKNKLFLPFWILTVSLLCGLTLPVLVQQGMFMDAVLYSSVSRNLALGLGSFWFPYFDPFNVIGLPSFHEQPPLVFGIQSIFFRVFGDHFFVERLYTFLTLIINAGLIVLLWRRIFRKEESMRVMVWLALICWITIPVCFWSYGNNMHENTMSIFVFGSIYLMHRAAERERLNFTLLVLAAILVSLAFLSKGFPGLFPLAFPGLYWVIMRKTSFGRMVLQTVILFAVLSLIGVALYFYPDAKNSLSIYLFKRVFVRVGSVHSVDSRFFILFRLFSELLPLLLVSVITYFFLRVKKISLSYGKYHKPAALFFCLGLAGTLPLMLTKVQNGFYMVAALPFFGISFAILNAPVVFYFIDKLKNKQALLKKMLFISVFLFMSVIAFTVSRIGKYNRDKELLQDVHRIGSRLPAFTAVGTNSTEVYTNTPLCTYLVRYYNISINQSDTNRYYLHTRSALPDSLMYLHKVDIGLKEFELYEKSE